MWVSMTESTRRVVGVWWTCGERVVGVWWAWVGRVLELGRMESVPHPPQKLPRLPYTRSLNRVQAAVVTPEWSATSVQIPSQNWPVPFVLHIRSNMEAFSFWAEACVFWFNFFGKKHNKD